MSGRSWAADASASSPSAASPTTTNPSASSSARADDRNSWWSSTIRRVRNIVAMMRYGSCAWIGAGTNCHDAMSGGRTNVAASGRTQPWIVTSTGQEDRSMGHMRLFAATGATAMMAASLLSPAMAALAQGRGGGGVEPFTLNLLVQDPEDRQAGIVAKDLVQVANDVSGGRITIIPTFDGENVADVVRAGDSDLAILP